MAKSRIVMKERLPVGISAQDLAALCERNQVQELVLFGSSLTDDFGEESDVDLLVTFRPGARVGFLAFSRIQRELEEVLGRKVDLVPKQGLKPAIRDTVLENARIIYP